MRNRLIELAAEALCRDLSVFSDDGSRKTLASRKFVPLSGRYPVFVGECVLQVYTKSIPTRDISYMVDIHIAYDGVDFVKFCGETQSLTWEHHSSTLETYLCAKVDVLLERIAACKAREAVEAKRIAARKAADADEAAKRAATTKTHAAEVLARFGINAEAPVTT